MKELKACQIFLYTHDAGIPDSHVKLLREAGFIPVKTKSLDKVKLLQIEPIIVGDSIGIYESLLDALQRQGSSSTFETIGRSIAARLKENLKRSPSSGAPGER